MNVRCLLAPIAFALLVWSRPARANVDECPELPPGTQISEDALQRHCEFAGESCSVSAADPKGVKACGGLVCGSEASSKESTCRLPHTAADCGMDVDLARTGGLCDASRIYTGKSCTLVEHAARASEAPDPDAPPVALPPPTYQPTQDTVDRVCGGLGCVDDPKSTDPTQGTCAKAQRPEHCGGRVTNPELYGGLCGPPHVESAPPSPVLPRRWMATGSYLVDLGNDSLGSDVAPGFVFQVGLSRSQIRILPNGNTLHFGLPSWYLHVATLLSQRRFGHELGLVYKSGAEFFTRFGVAAYGQLWSPEDVISTSSKYRFGPSAHLELFYNILVRGAWLPVGGDGPEASIGLQYAASLFDDFK